MTSTAFHATSPRPAGMSPVELRLGSALPRPLAEASADLTWEQFIALYSPAGPIRLGRLARTDRSSEFQTTVSIADRIYTHRADAHGPIAAVTSALYSIGISIELLAFHQRPTRDGVATFVHFENGGRAAWACAIAPEAQDSASRAMIAAANRVSEGAV